MSVRFRNFGLVLATASSFWMLPTASHAYTLGQQEACSGDAFRLCSADIPDVDRITVCMIKNKSQLSPGCRAFFTAEPAPVAAGRPPSIKPAGASGESRKAKKPAKPDDAS